MLDPLSVALAIVGLVTAVKDIVVIAQKLQQTASLPHYLSNTRTYSPQGAAESGERSKVNRRCT